MASKKERKITFTLLPDIKTFQYLFHRYKLLQATDMIEKMDEVGIFDAYNGTITIQASIPEPFKWEVFIHELIEVVNYHHELQLEHSQITGVATGLVMFLYQNPEFVINMLQKMRTPNK